MVDLAQAAELASSARTYAGALEAAGQLETSRLVRRLALELAELVDALEAERSARVAIQAGRDRALAVLEAQAGRATLPENFRAIAAAALEVDA